MRLRNLTVKLSGRAASSRSTTEVTSPAQGRRGHRWRRYLPGLLNSASKPLDSPEPQASPHGRYRIPEVFPLTRCGKPIERLNSGTPAQDCATPVAAIADAAFVNYCRLHHAKGPSTNK
jgi:hypothetical protein